MYASMHTWEVGMVLRRLVLAPRAALAATALAALLMLGFQAPAQAATKSDCDGGVCQQVTHYGGTVTDWFATVYPGSGYNCRTARFRVNGSTIGGTQVCGTGMLSADASTPYYLNAGDQLCTYFEGELGYACVTI
jgi:hypothetical protein